MSPPRKCLIQHICFLCLPTSSLFLHPSQIRSSFVQDINYVQVEVHRIVSEERLNSCRTVQISTTHVFCWGAIRSIPLKGSLLQKLAIDSLRLQTCETSSHLSFQPAMPATATRQAIPARPALPAMITRDILPTKRDIRRNFRNVS
jgi:hypothetical protein